MAIVRPFKAVRPTSEVADKVLSLPYDVMNRNEASEMAEGNPYSFLHICRSEIDLPNQENPYDKSVYEKAKENIENFLKEGTFCLLYTSDAADEEDSVDLGGRRII